MATEEAKAAAGKIAALIAVALKEMLPTVNDLKTEKALQAIRATSEAIQPLIDAEFAEVVKKAEKCDMALLTTAALQVENNELRRGRDDLRGKLKELHVTIRQRDDAEMGVLMGYISAEAFVACRSKFTKAYTVVTSLLIDHEKQEGK